jgi:cysteine desulfurase
MPFNVQTLAIDAASFSAHKIGGPKGVGAFYLKRQIPFTPTQLGGGQEGNKRSGTQNVAGIVGFAKALELAEEEWAHESSRLALLRNNLATQLLFLDSRISLTVGSEQFPSTLPNILSFTIKGFESETLILKLDDAGFAVSGGSACSTGSLDPSHVLIALGMSRDEAYSALRVSLGHENTQADIEAFVAALAAILLS